MQNKKILEYFIFIFVLISLIVLLAYAFVSENIFMPENVLARFRFLFVIGFILLFFMKERLRLSNLSFALIGLFFILSFIGTLGGNYRDFYFGIRYDKIVHFLFGFVMVFALYDFLKNKLKKENTTKLIWVVSLIVVLGVIHEFAEYVLSVTIAEIKDTFSGSGWDFKESFYDVFSSFIGSLVALAVYKAKFLKKARYGG